MKTQFNLNFHDKFEIEGQDQVTSFKLVQKLSMINKYFKCKGKIPNGSSKKFKTNILQL